MSKILISIVILAISYSASASFLSRRVIRPATTCTNVTAGTYTGIGGSCTSEADCQNNLYCATTNGGTATTCQYISTTTACTVQSDCGGQYADLKCIGSKCSVLRLPGEACSSNAACLSQQCVSGSCAAKASGATCTGSDCAAGFWCASLTTGATSGTCMAQVAAGGNCTYSSNSFTLPNGTLDYEESCVAGYTCQLSYSPTFTQTGVCTAVFSAAAGTSVGTATSVCDSGLFAVYNSTGYYYTCASTAPSCSDTSPCVLAGGSAECACNSATAGVCVADPCATQITAAYNCAYNYKFGLGALATVYDSTSDFFSSCGAKYIAAVCCEAGGNTNQTYLPSGTCSSGSSTASSTASSSTASSSTASSTGSSTASSSTGASSGSSTGASSGSSTGSSTGTSTGSTSSASFITFSAVLYLVSLLL